MDNFGVEPMGVSTNAKKLTLPVHFLGPNVAVKRKQLAASRSGGKKPTLDIEGLVQKLQDIRKDSLENRLKYMRKLKRNLKTRYNIPVKFAKTATEAVDYISNNLDSIKTLAINRSSAVREVLSSMRGEMEFNIYDSYENSIIPERNSSFEVNPVGKKGALGYWNLPSSDPIQIWNSFSFEPGLKNYFKSSAPGISTEYVSLVGVNCASSDGDIFFLQHLQNISNIMAGAKKNFIIIGLDKIVDGYEQAEFQARCTALFGYDTILLDLFSREVLSNNKTSSMNLNKDNTRKSIDKLKSDSYFEFKLPQETHVILLDNGRTELQDSEFREIQKCIACNNCSRLCPRTRMAQGHGEMNARDIILSSVIFGLEFGIEHGLFNCTLCRNCQDICPLEIPLVDYLLKLRAACERNRLMPGVHERIYNNIKNYNTPYGEE